MMEISCLVKFLIVLFFTSQRSWATWDIRPITERVNNWPLLGATGKKKRTEVVGHYHNTPFEFLDRKGERINRPHVQMIRRFICRGIKKVDPLHRTLTGRTEQKNVWVFHGELSENYTEVPDMIIYKYQI